MNLKPRDPLALDLCCGMGGWAVGLVAAGWSVIGVDIDGSFAEGYVGDAFVKMDVRVLAKAFRSGFRLSPVNLVVASPPCQDFSRHDQPWTRAKNPPEPDLTIWRACEEIAAAVGAPLIIENVRGAQRFMGSAQAHYGSFYLWGDVPPLMPTGGHRHKKSLSSRRKAERAMIPFELAKHIGDCSFESLGPEDISFDEDGL